MDTNTIISLALSAYFLVSGIALIVRGKFPRGDYSKYTEKSVKTFARVFGAICTIDGLLFIPYWVIGYMNGNMSKITTPRLIIIAVIFALLIIGLILRAVILKKRSNSNTHYSSVNSNDEDDI